MKRWHFFHSWAVIRTGLIGTLPKEHSRGWLVRCRVCGKERVV